MRTYETLINDCLREKVKIYKFEADTAKDPLIKELLLAKSNLTFLRLKQNEDLQMTSP